MTNIQLNNPDLDHFAGMSSMNTDSMILPTEYPFDDSGYPDDGQPQQIAGDADPIDDSILEHQNLAKRKLDRSEEEVRAETEQSSKDIFELVQSLEDVQAIKNFALDHVTDLAGLKRPIQTRFYELIKNLGVPGEWVRLDLKPSVTETKRDISNSITWTDYVRTANELGYEFRLNVLDNSLEVNEERIDDVTDAEIFSLLHARGLTNVEVGRRAFLTDANQNRYHPIKNFLQHLEWDKQDHIAQLSTYLKDSHSPIKYADGTSSTVIHAFLKRWLIGAVGKVYNSQDVQNPMLILDGSQGKGKSYFAKWLCSPLPAMHFEGAIKPDDKDYFRYLSTRWIWEVGELGATMRKSDREALKAFITQQDVTYRPAHGRYVLNKPALASFIGTVNFEGALLSDPTGHRRFWPVNITAIEWSYTETVNICQIWAQAYWLYQNGETNRLNEEERRVHAEICQTYEVDDLMTEYIYEWFDVDPDNTDWFTSTVSIMDRLKTYANLKGSDRSLSMQLASSLHKIGLQKNRKSNVRGYQGIIINN